MTKLDPEFIAKLRTIVENHAVALYSINNIYKSRAYRIGANARGLLREPVKYGKKLPKLALRHPSKLVKLTLGSRVLVPTAEKDKFNDDYQHWVKANTLSKSDLAEQKVKSSKFKQRPLISILTPVFNPPNYMLEELIQSVINQTYDNWELCLGEFADNKDNQELLTKYVKQDKRIKFKIFSENGGIGANSNQILKMTSGEFIALLDHDDLLTPNALFENVNMLNQQDYDLLYSDKDLINDAGRRFDPIFKPDWSPEMMLSANYLTHLNVIRKSLIEKTGGWDGTTDGAQDWDLFLKVADKTSADRIGHIPMILYHWRTSETSTALNMSAKPYALEAQSRTVNNHLQRIGVHGGESYRDPEGRMYVRWSKSKPETYYAIVVARQKNCLEEFVKNIKRHMPENVKFMLVHENLDIDNSNFGLFEDVKKYKPGEFAKTINEVANSLGGKIVFMRETIKINDNFTATLNQLSGWMQIDYVFAVAPKITDEYDLVTGTGRVRGLSATFGDLFYKAAYISGVFGSYDWTRNFTALTGKFFLTSAENIKSVGGFSLEVGDMEACDSLFINSCSHNKRSIYDPLYSIVDVAPYKLELPPSDEMKNLLKETGFGSQPDPYYNANLSNLNTSGLLRSGTEGVVKDAEIDI